ncbi:uncharacterized protein AMSG_04071 [Thecamonas trahens ATCC 50062]|uniref:Uncharacterized protein n=1 Tax=Thecamonas trahens ATCC 50062 TaxID=461836 RepID=A0A0L0D6W4_THETB|nr:hypothetical protein AMSG_04071 [Thecamonas trahens ATCC 50062]KNC47841.1 hypothetical protein AMSG_04071 [Thecamonas trahens ATCC 50062]|eukprot:XP_013759319.1 hypothetical protein AMSG_04071 [Thecamonas trahens ATCC 50062]
MGSSGRKQSSKSGRESSKGGRASRKAAGSGKPSFSGQKAKAGFKRGANKFVVDSDSGDDDEANEADEYEYEYEDLDEDDDDNDDDGYDGQKSKSKCDDDDYDDDYGHKPLVSKNRLTLYALVVVVLLILDLIMMGLLIHSLQNAEGFSCCVHADCTIRFDTIFRRVKPDNVKVENGWCMFEPNVHSDLDGSCLANQTDVCAQADYSKICVEDNYPFNGTFIGLPRMFDEHTKASIGLGVTKVVVLILAAGITFYWIAFWCGCIGKSTKDVSDSSIDSERGRRAGTVGKAKSRALTIAEYLLLVASLVLSFVILVVRSGFKQDSLCDVVKDDDVYVSVCSDVKTLCPSLGQLTVFTNQDTATSLASVSVVASVIGLLMKPVRFCLKRRINKQYKHWIEYGSYYSGESSS